jgi:hypothetical protein
MAHLLNWTYASHFFALEAVEEACRGVPDMD